METNFDLIFQIKISDRYQTRYQGLYEYEYEPLDELIATPPFHTIRMSLLPVHLWVSGRVALPRDTPRLSLSNPTVGGPS